MSPKLAVENDEPSTSTIERALEIAESSSVPVTYSEDVTIQEEKHKGISAPLSAPAPLLTYPIFRDLVLSQLPVRSQFRMKKTSSSMNRQMTKFIRIDDVKRGYKRKLDELDKEEDVIEEQVKKLKRSLENGPEDLAQVPVLVETAQNVLEEGEKCEKQMKAYRKEVKIFYSDVYSKRNNQ